MNRRAFIKRALATLAVAALLPIPVARAAEVACAATWRGPQAFLMYPSGAVRVIVSHDEVGEELARGNTVVRWHENYAVVEVAR